MAKGPPLTPCRWTPRGICTPPASTRDARFLLDNGHVAEVAQGDKLPNGMRVVSIRPDGVVVQRPDKKQVRLKPAGDVGASRDPGLGFAIEGGAPPAAPPTMAPMPGRPGGAR